MKDQVSGVITTYKRNADVVEKAIGSMLAQTYPLKEIIVVDDNFDDSEFCKPIKDMCAKYDIVRYVKQDGNKGACAARNLGIKNSTGEYIGFLDDDDEWLPEKTEKLLKVFADRGDEKLGMTYCGGIRLVAETGETKDYYNTDVIEEDVTFDKMLLCDRVGSTSIPLIKKEVFDNVGGFWEEQPARQDYEMWLRISTKYGISGIKDKLFVHTLHQGEQISKSSKRSYAGFNNIYRRYKKYYKKNIEAELSVIHNILANSDKRSFYDFLLRMRNEYLLIKRRLLKGRDKKV